MDADFKPKVLHWMMVGEVGISSEAIARNAIGAPQKWRSNHPHDPDDLRRCVLLLEEIPELKNTLPSMALVSPEWKRLVARWDELVEMLISEMPKGKAPKTYKMMQEIIYPKEVMKNEATRLSSLQRSLGRGT